MDWPPAKSASGSISRLPPVLHLKELTHAGLIASRQDGRFVIYSADIAAMNGLIGFLTENCCGGVSCKP
jgi:hypothetical protein